MPRRWMLLLALAACKPDDPGKGKGGSDAVEVEAVIHLAPETPTDPLVVTVKVTTPSSVSLDTSVPVVEDSAGNTVSLEPLGWEDVDYGWLALDGFPVGTLTVTGTADHQDTLNLSFDVGPYGTSEAFDPTVLAGRSYEITSTGVWGVTGLEDLILTFLDGVYIRVTGVREGEVDFALLAEYQGEICLAIEETAVVDPAGNLSYSAAEIQADTEPGPLVITDFLVSIAAAEDGSALRGGSIEGIVDGRYVGEAIVFEDAPDLSPSEAWCRAAEYIFPDPACEPCADGEVACIGSRIHQIGFDAMESGLRGPYPECSETLEGVLGESCTCSTATGGLTLGSLALCLVGLARRRRQGSEDLGG